MTNQTEALAFDAEFVLRALVASGGVRDAVFQALARLKTAALSSQPPAPRETSELVDVKKLYAYADRQYCLSLGKFRQTECLGWEHKVKHGQFGLAEFEAHRIANEHMGAHRGIYAAVRAALSEHAYSLTGTASTQEQA